MLKFLNQFLFFIALLTFFFNCYAKDAEGLSVKFTEGCQIDLNNDGKMDVALLIETFTGEELIVLIKDKDGYKAFTLSKGGNNLNLTCYYGKKLSETSAGSGKAKTHTTNGTYLVLSQPESSAAAYYWKDGKFVEVWISD